MMTYFYEQYSDRLHQHYAPEAHRSIINFTFYVSRGYLVFVPDIAYEESQSRIGQTLWEAPLRYIENSPIFWADRIETPLLILHNDHDGAVPWEQGIELFVALRRLGKPAWLINYNGQPHWPQTLATKRDWAQRLQQFFDHYLKDAPAPVWLEEGVPARMKGRTLGLEPAPTEY